MTQTSDILDQLGQQGHRVTSTRRRILEAVLSHDSAFTAEELVEEVRGVGRATVYRTVRLLVEQGVLCRLALEDGAPRYSLARFGHHHHMVCVRCGAVREFRESLLERALTGLTDTDFGTVVGHRIEVYVICNSCQAGRETPERPSPSGHVHD